MNSFYPNANWIARIALFGYYHGDVTYLAIVRAGLISFPLFIWD